MITSATATDRTLTINWDPPADNGGSRITSYDLRYIRSDSPLTTYFAWDYVNIVSGADLTYTIERLTDSTQYDLQVRARNAVGEGDWSDTWVETTAVSADATLSALTLGGVTLAPKFDRTEYSYTAAVGYTVTSITIAGTGNRTGASLAFLDADDNTIVDADATTDGLQAGLDVGENVIKIKVTAPDDIAVQTYTITVTRTEEDRSLSPSATDPAAAFASTASYDVQFMGSWNVAAVPDRAGRPRGAHFTWLVGAVHNAAVTFLASGERASAGVEQMAERGSTDTLEREIRAVVNAARPNAFALIEGNDGHITRFELSLLNGVVFTTAFPRITLVTKIDPSHDWFVGVSGLPLLDRSGHWLRSHELDLFAWDAGTEQGDDFSRTPSVETTPRGVITSIRGTGPFTTERMASLTFTLQSVRTERSLVENPPASVNIGLPVAATASSGAVSYSLGGADAASFNLDTSTGQLWTKAGVTYDYESKSDYQVTVTATDTVGAITTTVDIAIENVNEPPEITGQTSIEFAENRTATVATYRARDPEGEAVTWLPLAGSDGDAFELSASGALTFKSAPDHETQEEYQVRLRASADGQTGDLNVTVTVTDVNEPAEIAFAATSGVSVNNSAFTLDENYDGTLATFSASDPEQKPGLTYTWSLGGSDHGDFVITPAGVLSFVTVPDHERPADSGRDNVYDITVSALDSDGKTGRIAVSVTVKDVDEPPTITGDDMIDYRENDTGVVHTYRATNPEGGTVIWSLLTSDQATFTLVNGQLRFKSPPDYEVKDIYYVTIEASDGSLTESLPVTINLIDRDEPESLTLSTNQPVQDIPYATTFTDADTVTNSSWQWARSTSRSSGFSDIAGATSDSYTPVIDLANAINDIGYYLRATVTYDDTHRTGRTLSATSGNVVIRNRVNNNPPEFPSTELGQRLVRENSAARTPVGAPVVAEDDDNDRLTYSLSGSHADNFEINNSGQITVKLGADLDHEVDPSQFVTVEARDDFGGVSTKVLTITIDDVDEPPEWKPQTFYAEEDEESPFDALYDITDPEGESLTVVSVSRPRNGTARVDASNTRILYTSNPNYHGADTITYVVSDGSLRSTVTANVAVASVNDPPVFQSEPIEREVAANAKQGDNVGKPVTASDVDEDVLEYRLSGSSLFAINMRGGQISVASGATFDPTNQDSYTVFVMVDDQQSEPNSTANVEVTIRVVDQVPPRSSGRGGGGGGGGGPPPIPIPSDEDFDWNVTRDIDALDRENDLPTGIWSNGRVLWVVENSATGPDRVFAYELLTGDRVAEREFELDRRNRFSHGIWSDGEIVWIADSGQDKLFAYKLETGERIEQRDLELDVRNRDPRGIWSSGSVVWVLDAVKHALFAYDFESGKLLIEYPLDKLNKSPRGIWSDGVTIWVSDDGAKRLFAYRPSREALLRIEDEEFTFRSLLKAGNGDARGIWSDGNAIWVADELDDRLYSYNIPVATIAQLASLQLSDVEFGEFSPLQTEYQAQAASGAIITTVTATPAQEGAKVTITPADADAEPANGRQVAISDDVRITVNVVSKDGSRTRNYIIRFDKPAPPPATCLRGLTEERLSTVSYVGGSVAQLGACAREHDIAALFYWDGRIWLLYAPDAPEFLNRSFEQRFAEGLPINTALVASRPASASPPEPTTDN